MLDSSKCRTLSVIYATEGDVDRIFEALPSAELMFPRGGTFQMRLRTSQAVAWAAAAIADPVKHGLSSTCSLKLSNSEAHHGKEAYANVGITEFAPSSKKTNA